MPLLFSNISHAFCLLNLCPSFISLILCFITPFPLNANRHPFPLKFLIFLHLFQPISLSLSPALSLSLIFYLFLTHIREMWVLGQLCMYVTIYCLKQVRTRWLGHKQLCSFPQNHFWILTFLCMLCAWASRSLCAFVHFAQLQLWGKLVLSKGKWKSRPKGQMATESYKWLTWD